MKLIIDIPEDVYEEIITHNRELRESGKSSYYLEGLIQNGTPYNPSGDAISREALKEAIIETFGIYFDGTYDNRKILKLIDNAPPVDTRPQGEWIEKEDTPASVYYCCSNCGMEDVPITPFCPWCGAEMKGGAE